MRAAEAQQGLKKLETMIEDEPEDEITQPVVNSIFQNARVPPKPVKKEPVVDTSFIDGEERIYRCEHEGCSSSFKTRSSLKDHQKVHSDDR